MRAAALRPALLGLIVLLAACADRPAIEAVPPPMRPTPAVAPPAGPTQEELRRARASRNRITNAAAADAQSSGLGPDAAQSAHYRAVERGLLAQGRLRRDRVPLDAPITADRLASDFIQIALRDEYSRSGDRLLPGAQDAPLRRWRDPVRFQLEFGQSSDTALQRIYRGEIAAFAARLQRVTGHPVGLTGNGGNFLVLILSDSERKSIGQRLGTLIPDLPAQDVAALSALDRDNLCTVFAYSRGSGTDYVRAVALLRAELPPLLRSSCIHEELAQGMGLANDSPTARPSIFNDDEEFALLTRHDELLLQILYDPRLRPGMTEAEAIPIVREIAAELLPSS
ncbi:DUF2927 domain-containing protein [Paracoccus spongiarum]|uniref:DUF2927 domain-containing protein n=1 Tax=Paracoccus spongiarum TaxID=3064387 RepID=A0ABT9J8J1_9RHOB|nr:DUF2927 domain-containing protein [Paracoccus sp. 2205BS29-5]MDP5306138.1 DUF2927 domain-containing protein [Paracoccus sp. 2205BS29-5]